MFNNFNNALANQATSTQQHQQSQQQTTFYNNSNPSNRAFNYLYDEKQQQQDTQRLMDWKAQPQNAFNQQYYQHNNSFASELEHQNGNNGQNIFDKPDFIVPSLQNLLEKTSTEIINSSQLNNAGDINTTNFAKPIASRYNTALNNFSNQVFDPFCNDYEQQQQLQLNQTSTQQPKLQLQKVLNLAQPDNRDTQDSDQQGLIQSGQSSSRPRRAVQTNPRYTGDASSQGVEVAQPQQQSQFQDRVQIDGKFWMIKNDGLLMKLAQQCRCDWKKIAKRFDKEFTPYFLKMRYKELTSNKVHRKTKFTHKEDLLIAKYFDLFGTDWKRIANYLKDRTGVMVKNRYYSFIRKRDIMKELINEVQDYENTDKKVDDMISEHNEDEEHGTPSAFCKLNDGQDDDEDLELDDEEDDDQEDGVKGKFNQTFGNFGYLNKSKTEPGFYNEQQFPQQQPTNNSMKAESSSSADKKEIECLKEKVKSLEKLIIETQKELALVKQNQAKQSVPMQNEQKQQQQQFY